MSIARIELDFVAHPASRFQQAGSALFAAAVLIAITITWLAFSQNARLEAAELRFEKAERATQAKQSVVHADPQQDKSLKDAGAVLDQLAIRWDELFLMIEGAGSKDLGLLTLTPDPRQGSVRISAEAKTFDDMVAYVSRLAHQPMLKEANLVSYQAAQRDGVEVIDFMVVATWK